MHNTASSTVIDLCRCQCLYCHPSQPSDVFGVSDQLCPEKGLKVLAHRIQKVVLVMLRSHFARLRSISHMRRIIRRGVSYKFTL